MEILVRVLHNEWVSLECERDTAIVAPRDIAVLDPPAQPILRCLCVGVRTVEPMLLSWRCVGARAVTCVMYVGGGKAMASLGQGRVVEMHTCC